MHFSGHQSLCLLNCLRSKNTLKQGKFLKFFKLTAKPKVLENLKRSWKKLWKKFEDPNRVWTLLKLPCKLSETTLQPLCMGQLPLYLILGPCLGQWREKTYTHVPCLVVHYPCIGQTGTESHCLLVLPLFWGYPYFNWLKFMYDSSIWFHYTTINNDEFLIVKMAKLYPPC